MICGSRIVSEPRECDWGRDDKVGSENGSGLWMSGNEVKRVSLGSEVGIADVKEQVDEADAVDKVDLSAV